MRLVVDTNILFAGILRDGTTRGLLIDSPLGLLAPERMLAEIRRNADAIAERSGLSIDGVELLLALLTEDIEVVPRETFEEQLPEAKRRIGDQDPGDVPFLALAIAQPCEGIWTQNAQDFENGGIESGRPSALSSGSSGIDSRAPESTVAKLADPASSEPVGSRTTRSNPKTSH